MIILKRETLKQKYNKDHIFPCKKKNIGQFWKNIVPFLRTLPWNSDAAASISNLSKSSWFGIMTKVFLFICNFAEAKEKLMLFFTCALTWMFNFLSLIFLWPLQTKTQMQIKRKSAMDIWWGISICYFPAFFATIQKNHQLIRIFFSIINHKISIL